MAARSFCANCRVPQFFKDREVVTNLCGACIEEQKQLLAEHMFLLMTDKDRADVERLVRLAVDPGATWNESANAARAACKLFFDRGGLDLLKYKPPVRSRRAHHGRRSW
jgi:hypothetical protein